MESVSNETIFSFLPAYLWRGWEMLRRLVLPQEANIGDFEIEITGMEFVSPTRVVTCFVHQGIL
jgi:hypothetical protein